MENVVSQLAKRADVSPLIYQFTLASLESVPKCSQPVSPTLSCYYKAGEKCQSASYLLGVSHNRCLP
jgi:hypothetical protein